MTTRNTKVDPDTLLLEDPWTIWYYNDWRNMKKIFTFRTVAEFWGCWHHCLKLDHWPNHTNIAIFRGDIRPTWEDPKNREGGRWIACLERKSSSHIWLCLLLRLIGNTIPDNVGAVGCLVNLRMAGDRLSFWTSPDVVDDKVWVDPICSFKSFLQSEPFLGLAEAIQFEFKFHQDCVKQKSCYQTQAARILSVPLK